MFCFVQVMKTLLGLKRLVDLETVYHVSFLCSRIPPLAYVILYCKRCYEISKCGMHIKDGLILSNVSIHCKGTDHTEIQTRNGYVCSYRYVYPI